MIYVYDVLLFANLESSITAFIIAMHAKKIQLYLEGTVEVFLQVDIQGCPNPHCGGSDQLVLAQSSLIKQIIATFELSLSDSNAAATPAECTPLIKDASGAPASNSINYASVIGMCLYLIFDRSQSSRYCLHRIPMCLLLLRSKAFT